MRTTVILNLKGGVAKTASTVNIAAILARDYRSANSRVLLMRLLSRVIVSRWLSNS